MPSLPMICLLVLTILQIILYNTVGAVKVDSILQLLPKQQPTTQSTTRQTANPLLTLRCGQAKPKDAKSRSASHMSDSIASIRSGGKRSKRSKRRRSKKRSSQPRTSFGGQTYRPTTPIKSAASPTTTANITGKDKEMSEVVKNTGNIGKTDETKLYNKMPSLFNEYEVQYDKYSACLAATEGLRRARDAKLSKKNAKFSAVNVDGGISATSPWNLLPRRGSTGAAVVGDNEEGGLTNGDEESKRAYAQYVLDSAKVIKSLGLSVSRFNQLGREISNDTSLKEKVMEQAYLYRMAAIVNMEKIPLLKDPNSELLLKSHRRRRVQMFAQSITEIEDLRAEQTERLKRSLNVDQLPKGLDLCDPNVLKILSPKVKSVCEAFPSQAEDIVKKYGLNSDEFNQMLEETKGNPIFRWRVMKYIKKDGKSEPVSNR